MIGSLIFAVTKVIMCKSKSSEKITPSVRSKTDVGTTGKCYRHDNKKFY